LHRELSFLQNGFVDWQMSGELCDYGSGKYGWLEMVQIYYTKKSSFCHFLNINSGIERRADVSCCPGGPQAGNEKTPAAHNNRSALSQPPGQDA
jgi:hypothetical protein